jgi:hypothetical protein
MKRRAALFLTLLLGASVARAEGEPVLVVRIDDRDARRLRSPWVVATLEDGTRLEVSASDDGSDAADRFPGDHIWFARFTLPRAGSALLQLSEGGAASLPIALQRVNATAGKPQLVALSDRTARAEPREGEQPGAAPPPGGEREEDAPAIAVDAQTMPPQQRWTPWPPAALATAAAGGLGLLLLAQLARRLGERVLGLGRQVEALIWAIGRRAGPVERR